jgi:hypothetical protein
LERFGVTSIATTFRLVRTKMAPMLAGFGISKAEKTPSLSSCEPPRRRLASPIVRMVRRALQELRRSRILKLSLAIALGFSLWDAAAGVGNLIAALVGGGFEFRGWATWHVGGHALAFDQLFRAFIELAVVGVVALVVMRRDRTTRQPYQP